MTMQDDIIYACLLIISVPLGFLVQKAEGPRQRQWICSAIGLTMVCCVCGKHGLHSLITALVNSLIIFALGPK